jgi:hypothetical protein
MKAAALLALALLPAALPATAQGRKDLKKLQIKSVKETVTDYTAAGETGYPESEEKFNKDGRTVERIEYQHDGKPKRRTAFSYDENGDLKEESEYGPDGKLKEKTRYAYNALGEKTAEMKYDGAGALQRRHEYKYDRNGLKTERRTYDAAGKLLQLKRYTYTK